MELYSYNEKSVSRYREHISGYQWERAVGRGKTGWGARGANYHI